MKIKENGRSMVEMLGVLAIIGVLSAGALAGYSKAMFRHRVNQTIDEFSLVLQRFAELEQKGIGGEEIDTADEMIKYGLMPNCQKVEDDKCKLPMGALRMDFNDDSREGRVEGEFYVDLTDSKSCISFLSAGWENAVPVDWWNPNGFIAILSTDSWLYHPNRSILEMRMENIVADCQKCDEEGGCSIMFAVHDEI